MVGVKRALRIGMIGYQFMGRAHAHAYRDLPFYFDTEVTPVLHALAGRSEDKVREAASKLGFASYTTDWRRLIERDDIDVIDIVTPNHTHAEIAMLAVQAGKHVLCEKPLAMTQAEAEAMLKAAKAAGVVHMVCHNYRFAPAVQFAKRLIEEGRLGKIYHVRAQYLQDWLVDPQAPRTWRLQKHLTGSGALGDIGTHIIDLARFLVGEITEVVGTLQTFVRDRPAEDAAVNDGSVRTGSVDVDDAAVFLARFEYGALGTFEATRFAAGNRNGNRLEINGERGSVRWNLEDMNWLDVYFMDDPQGLQGFRRINCTEAAHPYAAAYWPAGHIIGYEHMFINLVKEFTDGIVRHTNPQPSFLDGARNQAVLTAVETSHESGRWVPVSKVE